MRASCHGRGGGQVTHEGLRAARTGCWSNLSHRIVVGVENSEAASKVFWSLTTSGPVSVC